MAPSYVHPVSAAFVDREPDRSGGILARARYVLHRPGGRRPNARSPASSKVTAVADEVEREISRRFSSPTL